jgi:esterase/lipase superfamily enzyme
VKQALGLGLVVMLTLASVACSTTRPLMSTPHLYSEGHEKLFQDLAPELKTTTIPLFFVTDRAPEKDEKGALRYGFDRSASLAYGQATVEIGGAASWDELVAASTVRERAKVYPMDLVEVREIGRTPPTPFPYIARGGFYEYTPAVLAEVKEVGDKFHAELNRRLALTPRKEVLLYVHGYNNDFRDAALTWAGMWHFFGREGVPVLYSWPAGRGGLAGYAYDRESGEFTVQHLKMLFRALAANPNIEGLRVLSHSRGTDVMATTLRELFIESRAAGVDPRERFRIRQLILAAPDLDFDVTLQRVVSEPLSPGVGHVTVYVSQSDKAIGLAEWLFSSVKRIGRLQLGDLIAQAQAGDVSTFAVMREDTNSSIVELKGDGGAFGHGYFHENPAVSSDVLQILRFDREPGSEHGRPLVREQGNFWRIEDDDYLLPGS